jgi:hypothetical protein
MLSIKYAVYLFVLATWLALLEVQIEGKNSWASALPCWRPKNPKWIVARVYSKIMGGLPLTGYHAVMFSFVFVILHFPFFSDTSWKLSEEMKVCSVYFLLAPSWDFLYFVWNPYFFLVKDDPNAIENHKTWLLGLFPADYTGSIVISLAFIGIVALLLKGPAVIGQWLITVGILGFLVLGSALVQVLINERPPARNGQKHCSDK